jgi:hypothetical protein
MLEMLVFTITSRTREPDLRLYEFQYARSLALEDYSTMYPGWLQGMVTGSVLSQEL